MDIDALLRVAIVQRRLLRFEYDGRPRIAEPHLYGTIGGVLHLQAFQVGGLSASGRLPEWRLFAVEKILYAEMLQLHFEGPRVDSARTRRFDRLLASVLDGTVGAEGRNPTTL